MGGHVSTPPLAYSTDLRLKQLKEVSLGPVVVFSSSSAWKKYFEVSKQSSKLIVIDFSNSWMDPPPTTVFAVKYSDVEFVKIDVDELNDVAQEFGVQEMPTFILMKKGKEVDKVVGAKEDDLQEKIEKHRDLYFS